MSIKNLRPDPPKPALIQCEQPFDYTGYAEGYRERRPMRMKRYGKNPDCCGHWARYNINGKNLCATHAGPIALQILIDAGRPTDKLVEVVDEFIMNADLGPSTEAYATSLHNLRMELRKYR